MTGRLVAVLVAAAFGVLVSRVAGPSDLWDQDQPKTVAYTVDIVRNGRWALPHDMLGRPATKPPMYNWIGVVPLAIAGPSEFVLKMPSVIGGLAVLGLTVWMGRRMAAWLPRRERRWDPHPTPGNPKRDVPLQLSLVAGVIWLACYPTVKLIYTARPDMVLTAFLIATWAMGTALLEGPGALLGGRRRWWLLAGGFWLCVTGAALTKGPAAIVPVLYVLLLAKLRHQRWRVARRSGIVWGLPLTLVLIAAWAWPAYQADPAHFRSQFIGYEVIGRVLGFEGEKEESGVRGQESGVGVPESEDADDADGGRGGPMRIVLDVWKMPAWFMVRFGPWSVLVVLALVHVPWRRWMKHAMGPAILWLLLVLVLFTLSAGKRADYLSPAYPAAAVLAAYWLVVVGGKYRITAEASASAGLVVAGAVCIAVLVAGSRDPIERRFGASVHGFVQIVDRATEGQPIVFDRTGYNPVQPLLGYNQSARRRVTDAELRAASWLIRPYRVGDRPWLVSRMIPEVDGKEPGELALFRLVDGVEMRGGTGTPAVPGVPGVPVVPGAPDALDQ